MCVGAGAYVSLSPQTQQLEVSKAEGGLHVAVGATTGGREVVWFSVCTVHMSEGGGVCADMTVDKKSVFTTAYMYTSFAHQEPLLTPPVSHRDCVCGLSQD